MRNMKIRKESNQLKESLQYLSAIIRKIFIYLGASNREQGG